MPSNRTDVGRSLLDLDAAHRQAMPRWRALLERVFSGDEPLSPAQKASLLGIPDRRQVLRIGGVGIAGAALLAACSDDDDDAPEPATTTTTTEAEDDEPERGAANDVSLVNTAISLEILTVDAYQVAIDVGLVESAELVEILQLFQEHHRDHHAALAAAVEAAGGEPYRAANAVVKAALVDPTLYNASGEPDVVLLAYDLEQAAAQTYVFATTELSTPELRAAAMSIGGIESRHATILDLFGELSKPAEPRYPTRSPLPSDAIIPR